MTQTELDYLATVLGHVPHVAFVLNKVDQIEREDRAQAFAFLREVLSRHADVPPEARIFCVSARQALEAKRTKNTDLLARSGFPELETYLTEDLVRQQSGLLQVAVATKAAAILTEALMVVNLNIRSLHLPIADLDQRLTAFDRSLETIERQRLASRDLLPGDKTRTLELLNTRASTLRQKAEEFLTGIADQTLTATADGAQAQTSLASVTPEFFKAEWRRLSGEVTAMTAATLSRHQETADALIEAVRVRAAELFEIPYRAPEGRTAFQMDHDPYWVTHNAGGLLTPLSERLIDRLLPMRLRRRRLRQALIRQIDALARRNVENLRWSLHQSIDKTFRRFSSDLNDCLAATVAAVHGAIRSAYTKSSFQKVGVGRCFRFG